MEGCCPQWTWPRRARDGALTVCHPWWRRCLPGDLAGGRAEAREGLRAGVLRASLVGRGLQAVQTTQKKRSVQRWNGGRLSPRNLALLRHDPAHSPGRDVGAPPAACGPADVSGGVCTHRGASMHGVMAAQQVCTRFPVAQRGCAARDASGRLWHHCPAVWAGNAWRRWWWRGPLSPARSPHAPPSRPQVAPARVASSFAGKQLQARCFVVRPAARPALAVVCQAAAAAAAAAEAEEERLRLFNLSPQPGSKKNKNRKGRGYGAGQVRSRRGAAWPAACSPSCRMHGMHGRLVLPAACACMHAASPALRTLACPAGRLRRLWHARPEVAERQRHPPRL